SRSANKKSTGLGLYIVKTIVKNHGGTISLSSVENEFTLFEVTLPLV
ncbi:MAG: HAMP domain-containing histidine kinase, partial [Clostridia bacterium]|nr:HAMP domain-containing histidine kinase [Clostridia bacterium]